MRCYCNKRGANIVCIADFKEDRGVSWIKRTLSTSFKFVDVRDSLAVVL